MADRLTPILDGLADLSPADLQAVIDAAQHVMEKRHERRRKELWGNVVATINKYVSEIGDIYVKAEDDSEYGAHVLQGSPGAIFII